MGTGRSSRGTLLLVSCRVRGLREVETGNLREVGVGLVR